MRPGVTIRLVVLAIAAAFALALAGPAAAERYVVLYPEHGWGVWGAKHDVTKAGGSIVAAYPQIDVVIAESERPGLRCEARPEPRRGGRRVRRKRRRDRLRLGLGLGRRTGCRARRCSTGDPFSPLQWYAQRIKAPEAHEITGGSPKVLVGVIDTGVDASHPDLNDNVDPSRSVSCVGGAPNQDPAAWNDDSGHGTNVAGVIAAEANGQGIVGIAPNVKLAVIKASIRNGRERHLPRRRGHLLVRLGGRARRRRGQQQLLGRQRAQRRHDLVLPHRPGAAHDHQGRQAGGRLRGATATSPWSPRPGTTGVDLADPALEGLQPASERPPGRAHGLVDRPQRRPRGRPALELRPRRRST